MSDVFISYAREDRDKAQQLARIFERQNWTVWWDKIIPPGKKYSDVIGAELASAKAVIVLWSAASVASDWVKDEAQEGVNRKILIPALVDKVSPPYGFRQVQTADLSEWDGSSSHPELEALVSGVSSLISKPLSESGFSTDNTNTDRRRFLLPGVAVVLVLIIGVVAYKIFFSGPTLQDPNGKSNHVANDNKLSGAATPCDANSRHGAAELTGKGLMMIDPGGNQAAAVLLFNEALIDCADYADAYFWRGQSFVALQQNDRAIADFKKLLELGPDADTRRKAQKFIADLEAPPATPVPTVQPQNTNTTLANVNAAKPPSPNPTAPTGDAAHAQVKEIFAADKSTRIAATTRLIIQKKNDPETVKLSVRSALADPDNKSGVINTLVYLENVDPAILKQNRAEIEKLLSVSQANGAQTAGHIEKVQSLLKN
jgi:tetratricopeptide (TPR) repeat protein